MSLGLKITGHRCAVTYREAAALGIDDLEHGFFVNTEDDPRKAEDACTKSNGFSGVLLAARHQAFASWFAETASLSPC